MGISHLLVIERGLTMHCNRER